MSNSNVRDTPRTSGINPEMSHPPERLPLQGRVPDVPKQAKIRPVVTPARGRMVSFIALRRTRRQDRRLSPGHVPAAHGHVMYDRLVRTISFTFLK